MKSCRRNCLLGALGAALMAAGDLVLSMIPPNNSDSGLYLREAYLSGGYPLWRPVFLLVTGIIGIVFYAFGIRAVYDQIRPECKRSRWIVKYGGLVFLVSGAAFHFIIGSLAYWTTYLSQNVGREQAITFVKDYYDRFIPALTILYIPMIALMLVSLVAVLRGKTNMPKWTVVFHIVTWEILLAGIPDIRQALGLPLTTADYVMSQASGNAACLIWFLACCVFSKKTDWEE